jgi:hypothetical protein
MLVDKQADLLMDVADCLLGFSFCLGVLEAHIQVIIIPLHPAKSPKQTPLPLSPVGEPNCCATCVAAEARPSRTLRPHCHPG